MTPMDLLDAPQVFEMYPFLKKELVIGGRKTRMVGLAIPTWVQVTLRLAVR